MEGVPKLPVINISHILRAAKDGYSHHMKSGLNGDQYNFYKNLCITLSLIKENDGENGKKYSLTEKGKLVHKEIEKFRNIFGEAFKS